jgi:hypothetical protein
MGTAAACHAAMPIAILDVVSNMAMSLCVKNWFVVL